MKPTLECGYCKRPPSARATGLERFTPTRPGGGRSIPPIRLSNVVLPQPEGPWTATSSLSATCMSRPRSAITSDFPVRYTLIRSFVRMFGRSTTSELEHARDVHPRDANRDREGRQEQGGGREDKEEERLDRNVEEHRHKGLSGRSPPRGDEGRRQVRGEGAGSP